MSPPTPLFLRLQTQNPLTLLRIVRTVESPPGPPHHYIWPMQRITRQIRFRQVRMPRPAR
ncbi:hypothetical protein BS47DRAFT_1350981 [Hydnum rufescens UP504]|uniref:Uncharacterized protein n=1 Tax=Hydnum rufescens UP504 TaxID=1448309 RepID=A0A9P6ALI5_9AGAM|nr:hypothetical protein BS47DRAFT_1350981 [Hydnum rufescens UP504]